MFVSMDANFGLIRKKNSGKSLDTYQHVSFFIDDDLVDNHVESYCDDGEKSGVSLLFKFSISF